LTALPANLKKEIARRRTFAIISHPDAGKTTLTEKLLLYGGAIHLAGAVKTKANQRHTTSDWMEIEKQRGISISTSVLQFEYNGIHINLLDTPGHKDFSEDTYRTLTAVDAAVMLIDSSKGVERQTRKLFEVCRMRGLPIFTFMNKMDRPGIDPLDLIDELEKILEIRACPMTWPIGMGEDFQGIFDRTTNEVIFYDGSGTANAKKKQAPRKIVGINDPFLDPKVKSELELLELAGDPFDANLVLNGKLTPVFFGSAMNNFGVQHFLDRFVQMAPPPSPRMGKAKDGTDTVINPERPEFSGFIFKVQANMDISHRDRVAFIRVCSGKFERNMMVKHARLNEDFKLSKPLNFFAQERVVVEEAWPGDIVGLIDTSGEYRIGDTLCESPVVEYEGVPRFSPEHFAGVKIMDPMKRKQLKKGLDQLSEEGVVQVYARPGSGDKDPVLAAVGALQFEVLQHRLLSEYSVEIRIERMPYILARWIIGTGPDLDYFNRASDVFPLEDRDGLMVVLFKSEWGLTSAQGICKNLKFVETAPLKRGAKEKK
jgi:peptide chain release factor 3